MFVIAHLRDIIRGSPDVKWESIKGLENAKRLLKEAVVMPIKYPKLVSLITVENFLHITFLRAIDNHFFSLLVKIFLRMLLKIFFIGCCRSFTLINE